MRGLNYGVLDGDFYATPSTLAKSQNAEPEDPEPLPLDHQTSTHMPESWVRGTMLIRLNSLANGASGVRLSTIETLVKLLEHSIIPLTPLRGSISASGDLSPLSYIGGTMQGKPNLLVWAGENTNRRIIRADCALTERKIDRVRLGPKEGLAIVNGTAASTSVAALAMHEALLQATLAQILTAMSVEALLGTDESFDSFFSDIRPHPGQRDSAVAIRQFLEGSSLMQRGDGSEKSSLRQDRYSIRTAPQWLGPVLEDFMLAHQQIVTELNSVTDNPLIDTNSPNGKHRTIHGGNFQARSITSAMEKLRQGIQTIGRMLFSQCTELINPTTNRGLPPNLVVDEPSESYIWKGTDIMVAALASELGFLANPVGSHVMTAEMGNQSINSLALISARYTLEAVTVLTQMAAAHLVALCQALDLRAMQRRFLEMLEPLFVSLFVSSFKVEYFLEDMDEGARRDLAEKAWGMLTTHLSQSHSTTQDSGSRFPAALSPISSFLLPLLSPSQSGALPALQSWVTEASDLALKVYHSTREQYIRNPDATPYLGKASKRMYCFIRKELGVPFLGNEGLSTPNVELEDGYENQSMRRGMAIGDVITEVYRSIRGGRLYDAVFDCIKEVEVEKDDAAEQVVMNGKKRGRDDDHNKFTSDTEDSGVEVREAKRLRTIAEPKVERPTYEEE